MLSLSKVLLRASSLRIPTATQVAKTVIYNTLVTRIQAVILFDRGASQNGPAAGRTLSLHPVEQAFSNRTAKSTRINIFDFGAELSTGGSRQDVMRVSRKIADATPMTPRRGRHRFSTKSQNGEPSSRSPWGPN